MKISDAVVIAESKPFYVADVDGNNKEPVIAWAFPLEADLNRDPIPLTPSGRAFKKHALIYPDGSVWSGLGSGDFKTYASEFEWLAEAGSKGQLEDIRGSHADCD